MYQKRCSGLLHKGANQGGSVVELGGRQGEIEQRGWRRVSLNNELTGVCAGVCGRRG